MYFVLCLWALSQCQIFKEKIEKAIQQISTTGKKPLSRSLYNCSSKAKVG